MIAMLTVVKKFNEPKKVESCKQIDREHRNTQ